MQHPTAPSLKHPIRKKYAELMYNSVNDVLFKQQSIERQTQIILQIEQACYNRTITAATTAGWIVDWSNKLFVETYSMNCMKYLYAIKDNYYIPKIISGEMDTRTDYSNIELNPDASKQLRDMIDARQQQHVYEKYFKSKICKMCSSKKIVGCEYQARALDEGSSFSYKCTDCNYVWRK